MRVLIDSDNSSCGNMGDLAMLQVAVRRLRELWPNAHVDVISGAPDLLARHCPRVVPVSAPGRYTWAGDDYLLGPLLLPRHAELIPTMRGGMFLEMLALDQPQRPAAVVSRCDANGPCGDRRGSATGPSGVVHSVPVADGQR